MANDDDHKQQRNGNLKNLFPTKSSFVIFIAYMALFINQGLLVTATKNKKNQFDYNPITVVLCTELLKLIVSSILFLKNNSCTQMLTEIIRNKKVIIKYLVPSFLYSLYNNLAFVGLSSYDPTTYFLLLQFRVVVTAVIYEILFSKKLTRQQWLSLVLLTVGCIIKQMQPKSISNDKVPTSDDANEPYANFFNLFNVSLLFILIQIFSSCFAGVYNELILKENNLDIMLQNVFMYIDSILCNLFLLGVFVQSVNNGSDSSNATMLNAFSMSSLNSLLEFKVILIMINNAAVGIVTSLFLKSLNSILKTFASALELMFTAILARLIFGIPLDAATIIAIGIVSLATWLYSINPVKNTTANPASTDSSSNDKPSNTHHHHHHHQSNTEV